jgi:hypothetical protein
MTPKEKAKELIDSMYYEISDLSVTNDVLEDLAKQLVLVAVNEVLTALDEHHWQNRNVTEYYREVKHEINNL